MGYNTKKSSVRTMTHVARCGFPDKITASQIVSLLPSDGHTTRSLRETSKLLTLWQRDIVMTSQPTHLPGTSKERQKLQKSDTHFRGDRVEAFPGFHVFSID